MFDTFQYKAFPQQPRHSRQLKERYILSHAKFEDNRMLS